LSLRQAKKKTSLQFASPPTTTHQTVQINPFFSQKNLLILFIITAVKTLQVNLRLFLFILKEKKNKKDTRFFYIKKSSFQT
jgi:hypothetical protein